MPRVGRNREKHKRLPKGWSLGPPNKAGVRVFYFKPTNALDRKIVKGITGGPACMRLGATHDEAATTYAAKIIGARSQQLAVVPGTVGEIVERATREWLPLEVKNPKTRKERARHLDELAARFGARHYARNVYAASRDDKGVTLRAMDIQKYLLEGRASRPVSANRTVRTWELVFDWARAPWGLTEYNPCSGLKMNPEEARDVLPEDGDIFRLYRWLDPPGRFMVALNRYYGRRKIEALGLSMSSAEDDGLHLRRGKDAKSKVIVLVWDVRLRRMWHRLMRWRAEKIRGGKVATLAALVNRRGGAYTETGFNSARKRAMERAGIKGAFTFHDLRAARASSLSREEATHVLAHDDARSTRTYRRGPHIIAINSEKKSGNSEKS